MLGSEGLVVGSVERGETPLLGDDDLLPSWELVSSTSESLHDDGLVRVSASDGHDDLAAEGGVSGARATSSADKTAAEVIQLTC